MFQTVGHTAIDLYAEAMGLPLYVQTITGASLATGKDYRPHDGDEVEDLYKLLQAVKVERKKALFNLVRLTWLNWLH